MAGMARALLVEDFCVQTIFPLDLPTGKILTGKAYRSLCELDKARRTVHDFSLLADTGESNPSGGLG